MEENWSIQMSNWKRNLLRPEMVALWTWMAPETLTKMGPPWCWAALTKNSSTHFLWKLFNLTRAVSNPSPNSKISRQLVLKTCQVTLMCHWWQIVWMERMFLETRWRSLLYQNITWKHIGFLRYLHSYRQGIWKNPLMSISLSTRDRTAQLIETQTLVMICL